VYCSANRTSICYPFSTSQTKGLQRIAAGGGVPAQVTALDASSNETAHYWPRFLPDGRHFVFQVHTGGAAEDRTIFVGTLDHPERHFVLKSPYMADVARGYLLFVRDDAVLAQRFDDRTFQLAGDPVVLAESIQGSVGNGRAGFTVSESGVLAYRSGSGSGADSQLAWVDRTGKEIVTVGPASSYRGVHLSPDAARAALHREDNPGGDVWILDLVRGSNSRFTFDTSQHSGDAVWSKDGQRIVFSKANGTSWSIFEKEARGVGEERLLYEAKGWAVPWSVTADGTLLFSHGADGGADLWTLPLTGGAAPSPYVRAPGNQGMAQVSPNGRWVVYTSTEAGPLEVYVQSYPKPGARYQVSTGGGTQPRWRGDGREIFYRSPVLAGIGTTLAVTVDTDGDALRFAIPEQLFTMPVGPSAHIAPIYSYDVTPDGKRFLITRLPGEGGTSGAQVPITVVVNWDAELTDRK
jgi:hypothetical protein